MLNRVNALNSIKQLLISRGINYSINSTVSNDICIRIPLLIENEQFILDFIFDTNFPFSKINVILQNFNNFLIWPHFEKNGKLCLDEEYVNINPYLPEDIFASVFDKSISLISKCVKNELIQDFKDEFISYWSRYVDEQCSENAKYKLISLPRRDSQSLFCYREISFKPKKTEAAYYIADDENKLIEYCNNQGIKTKKEQNIFFIVLNSIPSPIDYINLLNPILKKISREKSCFHCFKQHVKFRTFKTICGFHVKDGYMFAGLTINTKSVNYKKFKIPTFVKYRDKITLIKDANFKIEKAYHNWVYGRDVDEMQNILTNKRIAIVGCGSIGSFITKNMAMSGISNITVVDPDTLSFANISRNFIGTNFIDCHKSKAMEMIINKEYPHVKFHCICDKCQDFFSEKNIADYDLIICCTADYASEMFLMDKIISSKKNIPIIFAFAESGAVVGHCVSIIDNRSGCFQCGFAETKFKFLVLEDANQVIKKEPGCGGYYNPYGGVDINYINLMVSDIALNILLGKETNNTHHLWLSNKCGQHELSNYGKDIIGHHNLNSFLHFLWKPNPNCFYRDKHVKI